ncbi:MAG: LPXTG cell wall anchor domain-containing protein [Defluviitaleaceae bacterium]|nr:LPXTG cell wall anchor domain-containing protein [Defluviitaleaceae bacterium]
MLKKKISKFMLFLLAVLLVFDPFLSAFGQENGWSNRDEQALLVEEEGVEQILESALELALAEMELNSTLPIGDRGLTELFPVSSQRFLAEMVAANESVAATNAAVDGIGWIYSGDIAVNRDNFLDFFHLNNPQVTYDVATGGVVLTQEQGNQVGSVTLAPRIDMGQDFLLTANIFLGRATQQGRNQYGEWISPGVATAAGTVPLDGRSNFRGADGIAFGFHPNETRRIGTAGNGRGIGNLPGAFGFTFDTWWNGTGAATVTETGTGAYEADPRHFGYPATGAGISGAGVPFGGFVTTELNANNVPTARVYLGASGALSAPQQLGNGTPGQPGSTAMLRASSTHTVGTLNPTNNQWHHVTFSYNASTQILRIIYTHSSALQRLDPNDDIGYVPDPALVAAIPGAQQIWEKYLGDILAEETINDDEFTNAQSISYAFSVGAATGGSVNDQRFRILSMEYTALTGWITARYFEDDQYHHELLAPLENFVDVPEEWSIELGYTAEPTEIISVERDEAGNILSTTYRRSLGWYHQEQRLRDQGWYRSRTTVNFVSGMSMDDVYGFPGASWQYVSIPQDNFSGQRHIASSRAYTTGTITYYFRRPAGFIDVMKVDEFGGPLAGVEFEVRDANGDVVMTQVHRQEAGEYLWTDADAHGRRHPVLDVVPLTITTDADGRATTGLIPAWRYVSTAYSYVYMLAEGVLGPAGTREVPGGTPTRIELGWERQIRNVGTLPVGVYYLVETRTPAPHVLRTDPIRVEIPFEEAQDIRVPVTISNFEARGVIEIAKENASGERLGAGFRYAIYPVVDGVRAEVPLMTLETNEAGIATTPVAIPEIVVDDEGREIRVNDERLLLGTYDVVEVYAPYPWVLDSRPIRVTLGFEGERVETVFESVTQVNFRYPSITVEMDDEVNPEQITGEPRFEDSTVRWEILDSEGHVVASGEGSEIPQSVLEGLSSGNYRAYLIEELSEKAALEALENGAFTPGLSQSGQAGYHRQGIDFTIRVPEIEIEIDRPVNPTTITGLPHMPDVDPEVLANNTVWEILDSEGNVVASGPGTVIPEAILRDLEEGSYSVVFVVTDPETGLSARDETTFVIRFPEIDVVLDDVLNPTEITAQPSIPGVPTHVLEDNTTWEILDSEGRVIASGPGTVIPEDILRNLEEGAYTAVFVVTDPETGETAQADVSFNTRFPYITADIDRIVNPGEITGNPIIPGLSEEALEASTTWEILDSEGRVIASGSGTVIPENILRNLEEGSYTAVFVLTDPETRETVQAEVPFMIRVPEIEAEVDRELNPTEIVGHPSLLGVPEETVEERTTWTILDTSGNVVASGSGTVVPEEILRDLEDGAYTAVFVVTDPETGETAQADVTFEIRRPEITAVVDQPINPTLITGHPSIPGVPAHVLEGNTTWEIRDAAGNVVLSGVGTVILADVLNDLPNGSYTVAFVVTDPETGQTAQADVAFEIVHPDPVVPEPLPPSQDVIIGDDHLINPNEIAIHPYVPGVPEEVLAENTTWEIRDADGNVVTSGVGTAIPEDLLRELEEGFYQVVFVVTNPETGETTEAEVDFVIRYPEVTVEVDQPFNPGVITGNPSLLGVPADVLESNTTWVILDAGGNVVASGVGTVIPDSVLSELGGGSYTAFFEVMDPVTRETAQTTVVFDIRYPDVTAEADQSINPGAITGSPSIPGVPADVLENNTTWVILDAGGNVVASGVGTVIPDSVLNELGGGSYTAVFEVTDPETGEMAQAAVVFDIRSPEIAASIDKTTNPSAIIGHPSLLGVPADVLENNTTWEIRDAADNVVASGVGTMIPETVLTALAEGTYTAVFVLTDPETGNTAQAEVSFEVIHPEEAAPARELAITAEIDQVINPTVITGHPYIPGVSAQVLENNTAWVILDEAGNVVASGVGTTIPEAVLNDLAEGTYTAVFVLTDPETGETAQASITFEIIHPETQEVPEIREEPIEEPIREVQPVPEAVHPALPQTGTAVVTTPLAGLSLVGLGLVSTVIKKKKK